MPTRRDVVQGAIAAALSAFTAASLAADEAAAPLLGAIRAITLTAPDLKAIEDAWTRFMGYRVIDRGRLFRTTVESWRAPALWDKPYLILGPESGEPTYVRFVEQTAPAVEVATLGWTVAELTVQNADELHERLKESPFSVRGPPQELPPYSYLKALQVTGPGGEQLHLTWITENRPDLAIAKSFVGRCFIVALAAPDLAAARDFYRDTFGNAPGALRQGTTLIPLRDGTKLEIEHAGPQTPLRKRPAGGLPPGLAMVTFECPQFASLDRHLIAQPVHSVLEPHRGKRTGVMQGPAGELIELVEL